MMGKKNLSTKLVKLARAPAVTSSDSDLITAICDMGGCQNAIAIIDVDYTDAVNNIDFWTSSSDDCIASGTQQTETTNTRRVAIASDDDSLQAWDGDTQITGLAISSEVITTIDSDMAVAVELPNTRRYVAMQFTGTGTSTTMGVTFVGRDMPESGWTGARSAY